MRKKRLGIGITAVYLVVTLLFSALAFADDIADKRAELNSVQQQMQEMEHRRAAARERANAASVSLNEVMGRLSVLQEQANELQTDRDRLQASIDDNQAKLTQKKQEHDERMTIYKKRLRDIYINGQINYLDVLLGAKDFGDFSSRMFLLQKIISTDIAMLDEIQKAADEISARQAKLDAEMREIKVTQAELEDRKSKVDNVRAQRAEILYAAEEDEQQSAYEYERLLALSENIASMIRTLEEGGTLPSETTGAAGTGKFIWPCRGEITSYYGWRTHPIFGTTKYHSGMDIAVDYGTPIHAADSGTIIYSGWLGGYGNAIMIDHGSGLVTLYAHNDSLTVGEGQYVNKGTVVAYAGSTGWSTGPHCHFEVRLHGELTEPLDYLP